MQYIIRVDMVCKIPRIKLEMFSSKVTKNLSFDLVVLLHHPIRYRSDLI